MALFQLNPFAGGEHKPLYTLGLNKSVLIVGLGNVGKEFDNTRHNIGFTCLDALAVAHSLDKWVLKKDLKCQLAIGNVGGTRVILAKPITMMNLSGSAVQAVQHFYKLTNQDTVVVHDELDIDFGFVRTRVDGSDAGNNGVKSISQAVGDSYGRLRIGIGPKHPEQVDSADYVLSAFDKQEKEHLKNLNREVTAVLTEYISSGKLPHETRSFFI